MYTEKMNQVLDTVFRRKEPVNYYNWQYEDGVLLKGLTLAYELNHEESYYDFIEDYLAHYITEDGDVPRITKRPASVDSLNNGKIILAAYKHTHRKCYERPIEILKEAIASHPRLTNSRAFAHKVVYADQVWLDGLFMLQPLYAELAQMYGMDEAFDDIASQYTLVDQYSYDADKQLYYHAYDHSRSMFWADPVTGHSPNFWGRAMGWFAMSAVDVLDYFPENHPGRAAIQNCIEKIAAGILRYQSKSGVWYQILDKAEEPDNYKESSCSCMFAYFLKKAVMKGYLPSSYAAAAQKALEGIYQEFITVDDDGLLHIHNVCLVAGLGPAKRPERDGSYAYYMSEPVVDDDNKAFGTLLCLLTLYASEELHENGSDGEIR